MTAVVLALDAMGGDFGPPVVVPAVKQALLIYKELNFQIFGREADVLPELRRFGIANNSHIDFIHTPGVIKSDCSPLEALREGDKNSLYAAVLAVKEKRASGVVTAGSTGALAVISDSLLGRIPGIRRSALVKVIPSFNGRTGTVFLDLGANLSQDANVLVQNALMGSIAAKIYLKKDKPSLVFLNVGSESTKGPDYLRKAASQMASSEYCNFLGFAEGNDLFTGKFDVIVTDGFTGNIALKTAEGLYRGLQKKILGNGTSLLIKPFKHFFKRKIGIMQPDSYNGSTLLGLNGIVVKSHGGANHFAFLNAIEQAEIQSLNHLPELIAAGFNSISNKGI